MELPRHIFREYDIRGLVGEELQPGSYRQIGAALGARFLAEGAREAVIGHDNRLHSPELYQALSEGIRSTGLDVLGLGLLPTPALYYALARREGGCGAVVTASHNPPEYNGLKIVSGGMALSGDAIRSLRDEAMGPLPEGDGAWREDDILDEYVGNLLGNLKTERPVRVVVDCANGTAGTVARRLFEGLDARAEFLYEEPDGTFPNHPADPVVEANLQDLIVQVRRSGAELGIAFDGDSDRLGVVDAEGRILWGDQLLALYSRSLLKEHPGAKVIFEVKCSRALAEDIRAHGGEPLLWKTGHSLIKAKMKEEKALLAGEMSGHLFFADRYYGFDDALYAAGRLLEILSKSDISLGEMLSDLPHYESTPEMKIACPDDQKFEIVEALRKKLAGKHNVIDIDGVRLEMPEAWGLVRASNTSPVLVLRFEGRDQDSLDEVRELVMAELETLLPEEG
ncbi:MAG: phosphomannomutase/phosphoglucomutase [Candidatus Krumholzibacteria bacterium]|nr:phosphomannomutase/phosphoglucomutase [Candidatus Krumholzibacteria bacterium]MDP6669891.1 phosphomannomutase/phosphoglucomutase [Candidatus Krumholzibacteria bacterium]MDP6797631.1 phosphomannomutase/phosphoglucomutase [Candidatus Krumholzibacteria bacterium]MDP7021662.1 phosphomannomutase/phosphoglucomutase [Candidatus Krumholzibacteria bacterium]